MSSKIIAGITSANALNMSADTSGQLEIQTGAGPTTAITVDSSQLVTVAKGTNLATVSGNVGVGTSTPSSADFNANAKVLQGSQNTTDGFIFKATSSVSTGVFGAGNGGVYCSSVTPDPILFQTNASEKMRLTNGGSLGVGTTSPTQKFEVSGATSTYMSVKSTNSSTGSGYYTSNNTNSYLFGAGAASGGSSFEIRDVTNSATRVYIDTSGNLLVGTAGSPWATTKSITASNGSGSVSLLPNASAYSTRITNADSSNIYVDNSSTCNYIFSYNSAANFAAIAASAFNVNSDYRLKENIAPLTGALATISQFKPIKYSFKAGNKMSMPWGTDVVDGFLAHEFAEVMPYAVTGQKDAVDEKGDILPQALDATKAIPLLVAAIQELNAKVEALETKLKGSA